MIGGRDAAAGAPLELSQATAAVRDVLLRSGSRPLYGCCIQACLVLGWILKQRGYPSEMWSCSPNGWPHWCVRVDEWILDPAAGQFGDEDNPLLLFRERSPDHWYEPGREEPPPICEQQIIEALAQWIESDADPDVLNTVAGRSRAISALLELAGLAHLEPVVRDAGDQAIADSTHANFLDRMYREMKLSTASDDDSAPARLARAIAEFENWGGLLIEAVDLGLDTGVVETRLFALQKAGKTLERWLETESITPRHDAGA